MKVMITPNGSPNSYTVLSVDEYRKRFSRQSEMMSALGTVMGSVDSQVYVNTSQYIVSLPPVVSTTKLHKPLQTRQKKPLLPSVTEMEMSALRGVEMMETASDPLSKASLAKMSIRAFARIARKVRER